MSFLHFLFFLLNPFELNVKFRNFPVKRQIFSHKTLHPDKQNFETNFQSAAEMAKVHTHITWVEILVLKSTLAKVEVAI